MLLGQVRLPFCPRHLLGAWKVVAWLLKDGDTPAQISTVKRALVRGLEQANYRVSHFMREFKIKEMMSMMGESYLREKAGCRSSGGKFSTRSSHVPIGRVQGA